MTLHLWWRWCGRSPDEARGPTKTVCADARIKRLSVKDECFRKNGLMPTLIEGNKCDQRRFDLSAAASDGVSFYPRNAARKASVGEDGKSKASKKRS